MKSPELVTIEQSLATINDRFRLLDAAVSDLFAGIDPRALGVLGSAVMADTDRLAVALAALTRSVGRLPAMRYVRSV